MNLLQRIATPKQSGYFLFAPIDKLKINIIFAVCLIKINTVLDTTLYRTLLRPEVKKIKWIVMKMLM